MIGSDRHVFPFALVAFAAIITGNDAVNRPVQAQSSPPIVCSYDPSTGTANPLGMRTFITLTETEGTTEVAYEQFGAVVPGPAEAVLTTERSLIFPRRSIDAVRQLLLNSPNYYRVLVGFNDPDGFAAVNATLICRAEAVAARPVTPRPTTTPRPSTARPPQRPSATAELPDLSGNPTTRADLPVLGNGTTGGAASGTTERDTPPTFYDTIAGLADGNYRYVSGPAAVDRVYSDQELLNRGGVLFIFRKTGDDIIGSYGYIDGEAICVTGRVSGNTLSGQAYPNDGVAQDLGEDFTTWGPARFLRVRRTRGEEGERYYSSATLELNDFSKINAGSSLPPSSCP